MTATAPDPRHPQLVCIGEALVALIAAPRGPLHEATRFSVHVVGAELNVAVGVARLGHRVSFAGRTGDDPLGMMVVRRLRAENVGLDHLVIDADAPTGLLLRNIRDEPPPEVIYYRAGSAGSLLAPNDVQRILDGLPRGTFVHVSGVTPALSGSCRAATAALAEAARAGDIRLFADVNFRQRLWSADAAAPVLRELIAAATIVTATRQEAQLLTGEDRASGAALAFVRRGAGTAVIRDRDLGTIVSTQDSPAPVIVPARSPAHAVDTVGAGDAFNAGLLAGVLSGRRVVDAIDQARCCAAAVVGVVGDIEGLPISRELSEFADDVRR
ncbi:MAG TPA: sugar kinase [Streptosporangiaceae bacterium]|nr:sugar kinase [Streptosporangiaceae bacterium]